MYKIFEQLVKERQSCREFNDKPVDKNEINEVVQLAMLSPSACNSQPWKIYVVTNKEKVEQVALCLQERGRNEFVSKAKAFIVLVEKEAKLKPDVEKMFSRDHFVKYDIGELIAYLTLGAKAKGIDSCIIGWINRPKLKEVMCFNEGETSNIVIALGHSDIPIREKARKSKEEIVVEI